MNPRTIIDFAVTPENKELVLYRRGGVYQIDVDGYDLMSSRAHGSEEELARLAVGALESPGRRGVRLLVGGLGMGFTLRSALDELKAWPGARVEVAEFFQVVVDWNRSHLGHLAGHPLEDRRVTVTVGDVSDCFEAPSPPYDVILLDVDNGPAGLTLASNEALYSERGLARIHGSLSPRGVLAVWSSSRDDTFLHRLRRSGFDARWVFARARTGAAGGKSRGHRHVVFLGKKA
jgi:spermidine synthase